MLANANELRNKIAELTNRAKALEDALAKSYRIVSPQVHPLLSDGLLQSEQPLPTESTESGHSADSPTPSTETEEQKEETDEALVVYNAYLGSLWAKLDRYSVLYWPILLTDMLVMNRWRSMVVVVALG